MSVRSKRRALKDAKDARGGGTFVALPHYVLCSPELAALSPHAIKLLIDLLSQYRLDNNGDLTMAWTIMQTRGWKSKDTLNKARKELLDAGFIVTTRQGGLHQCSLFAVTFFAINECNGKHDMRPTTRPPGGWVKNTRPSTPAVLKAVA